MEELQDYLLLYVSFISLYMLTVNKWEYYFLSRKNIHPRSDLLFQKYFRETVLIVQDIIKRKKKMHSWCISKNKLYTLFKCLMLIITEVFSKRFPWLQCSPRNTFLRLTIQRDRNNLSMCVQYAHLPVCKVCACAHTHTHTKSHAHTHSCHRCHWQQWVVPSEVETY